jgi:hypothetical protein
MAVLLLAVLLSAVRAAIASVVPVHAPVSIDDSTMSDMTTRLLLFIPCLTPWLMQELVLWFMP